MDVQYHYELKPFETEKALIRQAEGRLKKMLETETCCAKRRRGGGGRSPFTCSPKGDNGGRGWACNVFLQVGVEGAEIGFVLGGRRRSFYRVRGIKPKKLVGFLFFLLDFHGRCKFC